MDDNEIAKLAAVEHRALRANSPGTIEYARGAVGFRLGTTYHGTAYSFDVQAGHLEVIVHVWGDDGTAPDHVCDDLREWLTWNALAAGVGAVVIGRRIHRACE